MQSICTRPRGVLAMDITTTVDGTLLRIWPISSLPIFERLRATCLPPPPWALNDVVGAHRLSHRQGALEASHRVRPGRMQRSTASLRRCSCVGPFQDRIAAQIEVFTGESPAAENCRWDRCSQHEIRIPGRAVPGPAMAEAFGRSKIDRPALWLSLDFGGRSWRGSSAAWATRPRLARPAACACRHLAWRPPRGDGHGGLHDGRRIPAHRADIFHARDVTHLERRLGLHVQAGDPGAAHLGGDDLVVPALVDPALRALDGHGVEEDVAQIVLAAGPAREIAGRIDAQGESEALHRERTDGEAGRRLDVKWKALVVARISAAAGTAAAPATTRAAKDRKRMSTPRLEEAASCRQRPCQSSGVAALASWRTSRAMPPGAARSVTR